MGGLAPVEPAPYDRGAPIPYGRGVSFFVDCGVLIPLFPKVTAVGGLAGVGL